MMKLLSLALLGSAAAFAPAISRTSCISSSSSLSAAKSAEEDIELTLKVIMENLGDDSSGIDDSDDDTPSPAPAAAPAAAAVATPAFEGAWSVGYDDTVLLAYAAAGSSGDYDAFKEKYLADTAAMVAKKGLI